MKIIFYLSLDPKKAKEENLPVSLPLLSEDFEKAVKDNKIDPQMILRGLKAQVDTGKRLEYYLPYLVYFLYDRARFYINNEDFTESRKLIEEAASYKKDYRYPLHLGIIERLEGNLENSEILLKEAVAMNPDYSPTRLELARTLIDQHEYEEAIEVCKKALEIDPSFALLYVVMGDAYLALGDYRSAITLYQQSLSIDKTLPVHWRVGVAANSLQKFSLAEREFRISIERNEGNVYASYNLSYSLYRQGKIFESIRILKALVKEYKIPEFFTELLILQKISGLYEEALEYVEEGLNLGINDEGFLLACVDIYALNGIVEKASKVCETLPDELSSSRKTLLRFQNGWNVQINLSEIPKFLNLNNPKIKKKVEEFENGYISENVIFDVSMLKIVEVAIKTHGLHFYSSESFITKASIAFSGSFETVGLMIFLYRVYFYVHALDYTVEESIDQIIPQIRDVSWTIGNAIAKAMDEDESMMPKQDDTRGIAKYLTRLLISNQEDEDPLNLKEIAKIVGEK